MMLSSKSVLSACLAALLLSTFSLVAADSSTGPYPVKKVVKRVVKRVAHPPQSGGGTTTSTATLPPKPVELYLAKEPEGPSPLILTQSQGTTLCRLLALNSGFVNGLFLSAFMGNPKQAVTAVTGAWTNSAIGAATGNEAQAWAQTGIIASYVVGSLLYGLMNPDPVPWHLPRRTTRVVLQMTSLLLLGAFGLVSGPHTDVQLTIMEYVGSFCLAAVASGLQNSLTSAHSGNLLRTTHYSGISSDMGTFLGQYLRGNKANLDKLQTFAKLAASFWVGGFAAIFAARQWGSSCLVGAALLPLILSLAVSSS